MGKCILLDAFSKLVEFFYSSPCNVLGILLDMVVKNITRLKNVLGVIKEKQRLNWPLIIKSI